MPKRISQPNQPSAPAFEIMPRGMWTIEMLAKLGPLLTEEMDVLVDLEVVQLFSSLSKAYIYELEHSDPHFPARAHVGRRAAWSFWGLQRWIRAKVQEAEEARRIAK